MANRFDTLGQRILQAARMAVDIHLTQVPESRSGIDRTNQRGGGSRSKPAVQSRMYPHATKLTLAGAAE